MVTVKIRADAIREVAARQNLSLSEIAKSSGIEASYFAALLRGKHQPSPRMRLRLLSALGLNFDELFVLSRTEP